MRKTGSAESLVGLRSGREQLRRMRDSRMSRMMRSLSTRNQPESERAVMTAACLCLPSLRSQEGSGSMLIGRTGWCVWQDAVSACAVG